MAVVIASLLAVATIPGLALFYGGVVGAPVRIATLSVAGLIVATVVWFLYGHRLVFGVPLLGGIVGNPLAPERPALGVDPLTSSMFGAAAAFVAVSIVASAVAVRMRMRGWLLFAVLWTSVVFFPVAYWILNESDGWAAGMLVADLGGGAYVHIVAGSAALALLLVLGRQRARILRLWPGASLVGALLLWLGWLGLNIAAEGVVDEITGQIVLNTLVAPVAGIIGWLLAEALSTGRVSRSASAEGLVAGLVAIAPACGSFDPGSAVALGLLSGAVCAFTVLATRRRGGGGYVVPAIHVVAAVVGLLSIGVFGDGVGFIYNGNPAQTIAQVSVIVVVAGYSFAVTWLLGWLVIGRRFRSPVAVPASVAESDEESAGTSTSRP